MIFFSQDICFCVPKKTESHTCLQLHEGVYVITVFHFLPVYIQPFL